VLGPVSSLVTEFCNEVLAVIASFGAAVPIAAVLFVLTLIFNTINEEPSPEGNVREIDLVMLVLWPVVFVVVCAWLPASPDGFCYRDEEDERYSCDSDYLQHEFEKFLVGTIPLILDNTI
jgi:hypothetical protein